MTTIRGKQPIEVVRTPQAERYGDGIRITTGLWSGNQRIDVYGDLSAHCAANLVRNLRRALRQLRDEEIARLRRGVRQNPSW